LVPIGEADVCDGNKADATILVLSILHSKDPRYPQAGAM
jgi:hypothetical protein